ncbi:hypothetical protein CSUNSWCD_1829 [Campylobacter showae CSUNSWCD]|uniref:Uncharacterized protein n=1 Tax=Campylobacter showae CSUNSWCD TaxID=1244083 RepID=M5IS38_9BACT|nr:hypothetical protein CSUNSWCD_1829 [Campylobacter showae CSUNSWCD]
MLFTAFLAATNLILRCDLFFSKFRHLALLERDRCNLPKMTPFAELFMQRRLLPFFGRIAM